MSVLEWLLPPAHVAEFASAFTPADPVTASTPPVAIAGSAVDALTPALRESLGQINQSVGMSIPAVRRAVHVIAGTISTFGLAAWDRGDRIPDEELNRHGLAWLAQPDPQKTLHTTMMGTLSDAIWQDRSVWKVLSRHTRVVNGTITVGLPSQLRRIQPGRVSITPDQYDEDLIDQLTIDGNPTPLTQVVVINWAGVGGLKRWGFDILDLYMQLQAAASRYAKAPHPKAILKNHGADLADTEVEALLAQWEAHRETRSIGYLNDVVDYDTFGWNAEEMQLVEAREHAALEVARLFGLPAWALDASTNESMTYSNVTDRRLDLLEALRPWMTPVEQTLSIQDMTAVGNPGVVVPRSVTVTFDASAYTRDAPEGRMRTWQAARAANILSVEEIRRVEPLADQSMPPPEEPQPAAQPEADNDVTD